MATTPNQWHRPQPRIGRPAPPMGWESVTLKVTGVPPQATTRELHGHFARLGNLVNIRIPTEQGQKGQAFLTFVPIPECYISTSPNKKLAVEMMTIGGYTHPIQVQLLPPRAEYAKNPRTKQDIRAKVMLLPVTLRIGVLTNTNEMTSLRTIKNTGGKSIRVNFDFKTTKLDIGFSYKLENPLNTTRPSRATSELDNVRQFKAEIKLNSISRIYSIRHPDDHLSIVIVVQSPPLFYKKRSDIENTHYDGRTWGEDKTWQRVTDLMYDNTLLNQSKTGLVNANHDIDIGRWLTYQIYPPDSDQKSWEALQENLKDFNVQIINTTPAGFRTVNGQRSNFWGHLDRHATQQGILAVLGGDHEDYHLPFAVRYQLEACISQGLLVENNITTEFLERLSQLARTHRYLSNPAADLLTWVSDNGKVVYDPMSIFQDKRALLYRPSFRLPEYCEWVRKVTVTPTTIYLNTPTPETTNRVLRQYRKYADRFLRVQFTEEKTLGRLYEDTEHGTKYAIFDRIRRTLENGIDIGGRHYEFLAFGNSQFREQGAYFFHSTSDLTCDNIREWMGDFSHIKIVAKYAARMGQCLSTTRTVNNLPAGVKLVEIPDIENDEWCFTDGVGKISAELATNIADSLKMYYKGAVPSAFQFRLGGSKGLLVVWPQSVQRSSKSTEPLLNFNELHLRPTQTKFFAGNSKAIEIVKPAEFIPPMLNRQLITILSSLGVPDQVFMDMTVKQDTEYRNAMMDENAALDLLQRHSDPNGTNEILASMVRSGFVSTKEPCVMALLRSWIAWCQKQLKEKARLVVEQGAFLFGCVDETNTLRGWYDQSPGTTPNLPQIFLQVPESADSKDYVVKTGTCVVGRNPSLHPGDLRVVEAVDRPELHHLRNVVVFPANGDRDIPSMCSGGDLDGDDYFVIWDPRLIPPEKNFPPMNHDASKPVPLNRDVEISDIKDFFVEYIKNNSLQMIAGSHLAHADRYGAKDNRCIELAKLHSKAVDYVKTGQPARLPFGLRTREWPHFMEKRKWKGEYHSETALGQIFDYVKMIQVNVQYIDYFDHRIIQRYDLKHDELLKARVFKEQYDAILTRIMRQRDIDTEFEVFTTFALTRYKLGSDYKRHEDIGEARNTLHERFTNAAVKEAGSRQGEKFRRFVAACYRVTWEHAQKAKIEDDPTPFITFPWIFHRELCRIATEKEEKHETNDAGEVVTTLVTKELELSTWPDISKVWDADISAIQEQFSELEERPAAENPFEFLQWTTSEKKRDEPTKHENNNDVETTVEADKVEESRPDTPSYATPSYAEIFRKLGLQNQQ